MKLNLKLWNKTICQSLCVFFYQFFFFNYNILYRCVHLWDCRCCPLYYYYLSVRFVPLIGMAYSIHIELQHHTHNSILWFFCCRTAHSSHTHTIYTQNTSVCSLFLLRFFHSQYVYLYLCAVSMLYGLPFSLAKYAFLLFSVLFISISTSVYMTILILLAIVLPVDFISAYSSDRVCNTITMVHRLHNFSKCVALKLWA